MRIGDLLFRLLADDSGFEADVVKKADKAGAAAEKSLGARLAGTLKTEGLRIFAAASTAAFGLATKGALELQNATARFRAETGASAEEAARAGKIINKVAGDERMALEDVTDIAIKVKRDLGAVGPIADTLTAKIARFARVTKQNGAAAVADIDDLVDAWGLSLEDVGGLLDKLTVSGQKWGGSIEADQKALAAMAPQLKAFNLDIDDGIALLDLFKASGLDAAAIPRALNSAIQKLDGRPLEDFVAELAGIEDPGERARRAIEIFGSRAGVGLANAIKPGMDSLDDFRITTEESVGAIDRAASQLDGTISGRIQRFVSQVSASIRGFGADFGAAATAVGTFAPFIVAGLKRLIGNATIQSAAKSAGAWVGAIYGAAAGAAEQIADFVKEGWEELIKKSVVHAAAARAGAFVGGVFGGAMALAERISTAIIAGFAKIPGSAAVVSAASRVGTALGGLIGPALGLAIAAIAVPIAIDEIGRKRDEWKQLGDDAAAAVIEGNLERLRAERDRLNAAINDLVSPHGFDPLLPFKTFFSQDEVNNLFGQLQSVNAAIAALESTTTSSFESIGEASQKAAVEVDASALGMRATMFLLGPAARRAGAEISFGLASGIRDKRSAIKAALDQLKEDLKNRLSPSKEAAQLIGQLFGKRLARGLKDSDQVVKHQAEGTRALIEAQMIETVLAGGKAGEKIQRELEQKMKSKDPDVRRQAESTKQKIDAALKAQPPTTPGEKITQDLSRDIRQGTGLVGRAAYELGRAIARNVVAGVEGSAPDTGDRNHGGGPRRSAAGGHLRAGEASFVGERGIELFVPDVAGTIVPNHALAITGASQQIGPISVTVDARGHAQPAAVGAAVRQGVADAMADVLREQTARLPVGTRA